MWTPSKVTPSKRAVKSPRPHICVCDAIYSNSINHVTMDQSGDVVRPIITLELIT